MDLETLTSMISQRVGEDCGLGARLKFDMGDEGVLLIDAKSIPNVVSNADEEADCTVAISLADFDSLIHGKLDPTAAFTAGKLRIDGDMGIAMKLGDLLR